MKKIITLALAIIMIFALCACGSNAPAAPAFETVTPGVLTVATSPDYAPYEFYAIDENGNANLAGFDIELAKYIAAELGLEIEFIPMDFDGVLMEVGLGNVDMGIAGLSPDPERAQTMDFSVTYYEGGQAFITTQANADKFSDLASANQAGLQIGAQIGTIQEDLAKQFSADADLVSLPKATDIIAELIGGKLDGAYIEDAVALSYQKNYPEIVIVCEVPYEAEGNVIGVPKGNEALLAAINEALTKCVEEGTFDDFVAEAGVLAEEVRAEHSVLARGVGREEPDVALDGESARALRADDRPRNLGDDPHAVAGHRGGRLDASVKDNRIEHARRHGRGVGALRLRRRSAGLLAHH